ncbi:Centromere/kinetochore protein zw10 like [Apostasia shenzhenica]|uniref:Centromere/kinetochore protein zw10 like n=1 Tax=Apostasia shenzhenica TaxID=1088818 RepID=A0A2I0A532_9ASPA|nr:Centromere/kinetochore protein zw10 like [Apostasia shenzhenica]
MDVLVGSIDVRELLSTADLDESSPLSAPDLRLLIDRLQIRSLDIKSKVRDYVVSHRDHFAEIFSRCAAAAAGAEDTAAALADVLRLLSDCPADREICDLVREIGSKRRELEERREALAVVKTISSLLESLKAAREDVGDGRVVEAAMALRDLRKRLRVVEVEEEKGGEGEPAVFGFLRKEWLRCFDELQRVLARNVEKSIHFESEKCTVTVRSTLRSGKIEFALHQVLEAMEIVGTLDYGLAKVADLMIKHIISPTIVNKGIIVLEELCEDSVVLLKLISSSTSQAVPEDAAKMAEFEDVIRLTCEFENNLKAMNFLSFDDNKGERLSNFAHNVEVHFASKKKNEILAKARSILLQLNSLEATSDTCFLHFGASEGPSKLSSDLLFQPESCCVSTALSQVLELVHETLTLAKQLNEVSQEAIIAHNDCYYLSHEILGLAFEYRADFPSCLKKVLVFADIAPNYYLMAENILQQQIQFVISNFKTVIDGADGFQNTHQPQNYNSAKFSIDLVVLTLEEIRVIWEPLMVRSTYKRSMCILLDTIFSRITRDLLLLDDMAAEETLQLQRLIHMALEVLSPYFQSVISAIDEKEKVTKNGSISLLDELIPSLSKFQRLADLFDMPLKSITASWESGELLSCGFTSSEEHNCSKISSPQHQEGKNQEDCTISLNSEELGVFVEGGSAVLWTELFRRNRTNGLLKICHP